MTRFYAVLLTLATFVFYICGIQADHVPLPQMSMQKSELETIDAEIETLQASLEKVREDALNKEIKSQPLLFDNWNEFAKGIEANEDDEKKIVSIKKQIDSLQQRKDALLKNHPQK
jgi:hypothetical protein